MRPAQRFRYCKQMIERLESRRLLAGAVAGVGNGLVANYYSDSELTNLALTRVDPTVNFQWGSGSPAASVPANFFSARWIGKVQAQFTESYTFYTNSDEGVALWVNGQQLIDNFSDHTLSEDSGTISLKAGEVYDIRLEYYETAFDATMQLSWSSASQAKQIIPQSQLYGDAGWTSGAFLNSDVGSPAVAGSVSSLGKTYNINGGGSGTGGASDQFQFFYQVLEGDGTIVAQVNSTQGSSGGAEAGIMIRDSLIADSAFAAININAAGVEQFESRASSGATATSANASGASGLYWLKLVRDGNFFRAYASATGAENSWSHFGSANVPMGRTALVGLTATGGSGISLNHASFKNVKIITVPPIGAGLEQVRDFAQGNVFVDIAKQMRTFQGPDLGPFIATDANGNPAADFWTIFLTGATNTAHIYNGTYKLSFTGQADLNTWQTPGGQVLNKVYNAGTNTTTADVVVSASDANDGWYFGMNFINTRKDAGSALNTGVTNIKMIRPGYAADTTQTFTNAYLQHLKQFSVLRFMDWTATNSSTVANWSDRTTLGSARQSSTAGVAWEYVVQLANQLDKDVWVNVPARASNDYITQLATLLKNSLEPDRVVYVEYSNEVWNGIFGQYADNLNATIAEVAAGNSPLNNDGETNNIYLSWRRTAKRSKEIADLFAGVWGQSAINSRVRTVLAGQFANTEVVKHGLEFIERTYGAPGQWLYAIASAPYFGFSSLDNSSNSLTVDQILNAMQGSVNAKQYFGFDTLARRYGLANMVYEGGPDTAGPNNINAKIAAQLDPRMKDVVTSYLNGWYNTAGSLFNWFIAGPTNWTTSNGTWGLTNHIENLTSPKILGTSEVATRTRQALTYGIAVPAEFDARAIAGATLPYSTTYLKNPGEGKTFDYFLRVPKAGAYRIVLNAGTTGGNEQLRIGINGAETRTITLASTGSLTSFADNLVGNFHLEEGMNLIHVLSANEVDGWNLQTVTVQPPGATSAAPTVASSANASPATITTQTTNVSVLGADDGGEGNLTYSWEAVNDQPTSVTFSINGTNAAKNAVATFSRPGSYTLRCTISDGTQSTTSSAIVTVVQTVTSISVAPTGDAIANGETKQLVATAKDQFGIQLYAQPSFTWSVDNAFGAVSQSGLYQSPASGLGTATIRATVGGISGTATVITQSPRPADNPANVLPGIEYTYYEGVWTVVPNFDSLTPIATGLLSNISITPRQRNDNFGFQYTGYVSVPTSGTYTFYVSSDDGSKLYVGGQLVVNNDGKHSAQERSGQIILDAGWHSFKLAYFEATGNESLSWAYAGPGVSKQAIPDGSLERVDRAPTVATPPAAQPNPITGTQTNLTVFGADESGESILNYTWSAISLPSGAASPTFSANGSNASKNTTATFTHAGNYQLQVAISDGILTTNATVNVVVDATVTSLQISPLNPTVEQFHTQQFSASGSDQFGNTISNLSANWSVSANGGTIDATGLYTAPATPGNYTVSVSANGTTAQTSVEVIAGTGPYLVTQPAANPNPVTGTQAALSVLGGDDGGEASLTYTWSPVIIPEGAALPTFSINGSNAAKETIVTFSQPGSYRLMVQISDGFQSNSGTLDITVIASNATPTVATPASATPSPVTGTSTLLSVLGADDGGEAGLTYTWATTGSPPAGVSFSANGSNAAKNTTATFTKAGTYDFAVTISDGSLSSISNVSVTVNQTVTSITLSPTSAAVVQGANRQFTASAFDQFGTAMVSPPAFVWSVSSTGTGGTITQAGLYTAPSSGAPTDTVRATVGSVFGTATVTVVPGSPVDVFGNNTDIGSPTLAGSVSFNGSTYTVQASGADIFGTSDQFHYVYRPITGDGQIIVRVASVQNTHSRAKAGVMFRDTLAANSRHVMLCIAPDNQTSLQYRFTTGGGSATQNMSGSPAPYWLKLVRAGGTFTGYRSPDGATWTLVGSVGVAMGTTVYVGLALTSHNNAVLTTSTFTNAGVFEGAALMGSPISAPAALAATSAPAAGDGNLSTFYQSSSASGAWVGLDFGSAKTITQIRYVARKGYESRMVGGKFQGSNTAGFAVTSDLYVIKSPPKSGQWTTPLASLSQAFRYVRYLAPGGSFGDIAEASFIGF